MSYVLFLFCDYGTWRGPARTPARTWRDLEECPPPASPGPIELDFSAARVRLRPAFSNGAQTPQTQTPEIIEEIGHWHICACQSLCHAIACHGPARPVTPWKQGRFPALRGEARANMPSWTRWAMPPARRQRLTAAPECARLRRTARHSMPLRPCLRALPGACWAPHIPTPLPTLYAHVNSLWVVYGL